MYNITRNKTTINKVISVFPVYECCSGATVLASPESQTEFGEV